MKLLILSVLFSVLHIAALADSTITCSTCPTSTPAGPDIVTRTNAQTTPCSAAVLTAVTGSSTGGVGSGGTGGEANNTGGGSGGGAGETGGGAQPTPSPNAGGKVIGSASAAIVGCVVAVFVL